MDACRQNCGRTLRSARLQFECSIISMVQYRHKIRFGFRRTPWRFVTCSNATGSMKVAIFSGKCRRVALVTSVAIDCVRYNGLQLNFWSYQLDASVERLAHLDQRYTHGIPWAYRIPWVYYFPCRAFVPSSFQELCASGRCSRSRAIFL